MSGANRLCIARGVLSSFSFHSSFMPPTLAGVKTFSSLTQPVRRVVDALGEDVGREDRRARDDQQGAEHLHDPHGVLLVVFDRPSIRMDAFSRWSGCTGRIHRPGRPVPRERRTRGGVSHGELPPTRKKIGPQTPATAACCAWRNRAGSVPGHRFVPFWTRRGYNVAVVSSPQETVRDGVARGARLRHAQAASGRLWQTAPVAAAICAVLAAGVRWGGWPLLLPLLAGAVAVAGLAIYIYLSRRDRAITDATAAGLDEAAALGGELRSASWFAARDTHGEWVDYHVARAADRLEAVDWTRLYPPVAATARQGDDGGAGDRRDRPRAARRRAQRSSCDRNQGR